MEHKTVTKRKSPTLPPVVISPAEVVRLCQELAQIDEALLQLKLRSGGEAVKMPKTSRLLDATAEHNYLNLLVDADRKLLKLFLGLVVEKAPRLHFSFGSDPSSRFLETLIAWLRKEIHPHALVTIGLQPNIGAGCIMRTTNRYFDFSLQQTFTDKRDMLIKKIKPADAQVQA